MWESRSFSFVGSEAAFAQLHPSGLVAVHGTNRGLLCVGCSTASKSPTADTSLFTAVLELATATVYVEKTDQEEI